VSFTVIYNLLSLNQLTDSNSNCIHSVKYHLTQLIPAEIRMKIYKMVLKDERLAKLDCAAWDISPPIQRTCRQIYEETKGLFYEVNSFAYHVSTKAWPDLRALSPINARQANFLRIKSLVLFVDGCPPVQDGRFFINKKEIMSNQKIMTGIFHAPYGTEGLQITVILQRITGDSEKGLEQLFYGMGLLRRCRSLKFVGTGCCSQASQ
jgi:hypothetical protein